MLTSFGAYFVVTIVVIFVCPHQSIGEHFTCGHALSLPVSIRPNLPLHRQLLQQAYSIVFSCLCKRRCILYKRKRKDHFVVIAPFLVKNKKIASGDLRYATCSRHRHAALLWCCRLHRPCVKDYTANTFPRAQLPVLPPVFLLRNIKALGEH